MLLAAKKYGQEKVLGFLDEYRSFFDGCIMELPPECLDYISFGDVHHEFAVRTRYLRYHEIKPGSRTSRTVLSVIRFNGEQLNSSEMIEAKHFGMTAKMGINLFLRIQEQVESEKVRLSQLVENKSVRLAELSETHCRIERVQQEKMKILGELDTIESERNASLERMKKAQIETRE